MEEFLASLIDRFDRCHAILARHDLAGFPSVTALSIKLRKALQDLVEKMIELEVK